ncbi:9413_t:CDS:2, partial [Cetraspora pellucida]
NQDLVIHSLTHRSLDNISQNALKSHFAKRQENTNRPPILGNYFQDGVWVMDTGIGTSQQQLFLIYDTESADSFVLSNSCDETCAISAIFDETKSSTYLTLNNKPSTIGRFSISEFGEDYVGIPGLSQMKQRFGLVSSVEPTNDTTQNQIDFLVSGTLGLAYETISNYKNKYFNYSNICTNLHRLGVIKRNIFSVLLVPQRMITLCQQSPGTCSQSAQNGGALVFGGYNPEFFGGIGSPRSQIIWTPVIEKGIKIIKDDNYHNTIDFGENQPTAIISTTRTQLVFSVDIANNITNAVGGYLDPNYGYVGPCNVNINIGFTLGSTKTPFFSDPDSFYKTQIDKTSQLCYAGFTDMNIAQLSYWVLGTPFLKNVYVSATSYLRIISHLMLKIWDLISTLNLDISFINISIPKS